MHVTYAIAFTSGIISFLAPCVFPLLPAYISMVTGVSLSKLADKQTSQIYRRQVITNSFLYIFGFTLVFVLMGLGASILGQTLTQNRLLLSQFGGVVVILFGLIALDVLSWGNRDFRFTLPDKLRQAQFLGPFLIGMTFAFAWTPCVGGVLGAILTLAITQPDIFRAAWLLFFYSLGISVPFLLIALTIGSSYPLLQKLGPKLVYIQKVGGVLLIVTGILLLTGWLPKISISFLGYFSNTSYYQTIIERL